ncbi:MAG: EamA family transporter [Deltaproteobacteria bacterium]|nr:EamA family transporter [Deltaproteobacteria bacterium]
MKGQSAQKGRPWVYVKLLLTAIFWGGTFIAGRIVAGDVGPFSAAFLRFAVASLFLLCLTRQREGCLPRIGPGQAVPLIFLGLTGVFSYNVLFFKGLHLINAGRASLIIANNPVFIALFSALIFKERLTVLKAAGIVLSVLGAVVVISRGNLGEILQSGIGLGEACILGCVASWVAYSLLGKAVMSGRGLSPLVSVTYSSLIGALALFPPALVEGMPREIAAYPAGAWLGIVYLGFFGTVLGFVWYYEGIQAIGPTKAGQFINFVPVSAIVLAFFILGEPVTLSLIVGGLLIISGVYLTNRR